MEKSKIKKVKDGLKVKVVKGNSRDTSCCILCEKVDGGLYLSSSEAREKMGKASKCFPQHLWRKVEFFTEEKDSSVKIHAQAWICTDCIKRGEFPLRGVKGAKELFHIPASYSDSLRELLKL